jgi:two-component system invasion response regulator UvrY
MNILIVDDHVVLRKGLLQILLSEFPDASIVEAGNSGEAFKEIRKQNWDLILLDISMPGQSGIDILKQIRAEENKVPVLMLSMHPESQYAVRALKSGASGFLNKQSATDELINAVKRILTGRKYITPSVAESLADNLGGDGLKQSHEELSDREMQVLLLLSSGRSVSEIADEIALSTSTVSTYRTRILEKLSLKNNAELTRYALDNGLI